MSWDIDLCDPVTGNVITIARKHHITGGTYEMGGTNELTLNLTCNYDAIIKRVIEGGIQSLDRITGDESIPILRAAIVQLGYDVDYNYWLATEGNAKLALLGLLTFAGLRPDGVWRVA